MHQKIGRAKVNLRGVVRRYIESPSQLELLAAMAENPARAWDAQNVVDTFAVPLAQARQDLERLCGRNLLDVRVANTVIYRFAPGSPEISEAIGVLLSAYRSRPVMVAALASSPARVRKVLDLPTTSG